MTLTRKPGRKPICNDIAGDLRQKIRQQVYDPGQRLPTTVDLGKVYGVSPVTIVKAVNQLKSEGVLETRSGTGIFVSQTTDTPSPALTPMNTGLHQVTTIFVSRTQDMMTNVTIDEAALYIEGIKQQMVTGIQEASAMLGIRHHMAIISHSQFANRDPQVTHALETASAQSQAIMLACDKLDVEHGRWIIEQVACPVVFLSFENHPMSPLNVVIKDTYYSTYQLLESLIDKGYRKIGCFGAPDRYKGRHRAFRDVHEDHNLPSNSDWFFAADDNTVSINQVAQQIVQMPASKRPELIFCYNDFRAIALLEQAKSVGLDVPGDLAIAGFDGHPKAVKLGITTVDISAYQKGVNATLLAQALVSGKLKSPVCQTVCGQISWGQTT
jgi:LacI family transcriptional regulator